MAATDNEDDQVMVFHQEGDPEEEKALSSDNLADDKNDLVSEDTARDTQSSSRQESKAETSANGEVSAFHGAFNLYNPAAGTLRPHFTYPLGAYSMMGNGVSMMAAQAAQAAHAAAPMLMYNPIVHQGIPYFPPSSPMSPFSASALYPGFGMGPWSPAMYSVTPPPNFAHPGMFGATSSSGSSTTGELKTSSRSPSHYPHRPSLLPSTQPLPKHANLPAAAGVQHSINNASSTNQIQAEDVREVSTKACSSRGSNSSDHVPGEKHASSRRASMNHIKKPLNAFMLFMKEMRAKVAAECTLKESAAINQMLGRKWHQLDRDEQQKYYTLARKERELHAQLYPNWSARENYAIKSKKRKKPIVEAHIGDHGSPKKCRARFGINQQNQWCKPCRRKKRCIRVFNGEDAGEFSDSGSVSRSEETTMSPESPANDSAGESVVSPEVVMPKLSSSSAGPSWYPPHLPPQAAASSAVGAVGPQHGALSSLSNFTAMNLAVTKSPSSAHSSMLPRPSIHHPTAMNLVTASKPPPLLPSSTTTQMHTSLIQPSPATHALTQAAAALLYKTELEEQRELPSSTIICQGATSSTGPATLS